MDFCSADKQRNWKNFRKCRKSLLALTVALSAGTSLQSHALDYGIYDARALAMGGTTIAMATAQHAQFYNPALLAAYDGHEEDTNYGRFYFPMFTMQVSESVFDTVDAIDEDYGSATTDAVEAFNANQNADNANEVVAGARGLQTSLVDIGNRDLFVDAFMGLSVSEPSDRAGGSFFVGSRILAGGTSRITDSDLDLLDDYIEAMDFVASGGASGAAHLELYDADGNLVDPSDQIDSTASFSTLVIAEWGLALSKEVWVYKQPLALGVTPKVTRAEVFSDSVSYGDTDIDYQDDKRSFINLNVDVGLMLPIGDHFRLGLAAKDLIPVDLETANGDIVELRSRARMGMAFVSKYVDFGIDVDLQKNDTISSEIPIQEATAGIEYRPFRWLDIRLGYRQDLEGLREDIISGGVKLKGGPFIAEFAVSQSDDMAGGSFQIGWSF